MDDEYRESPSRDPRYGKSSPMSSLREEQPDALERLVDKLAKQNEQLKAELDNEHRNLWQMEADLEREEQAIAEIRQELATLESDQCPVCEAMVPHDEIHRHMESCLHQLTVHVAKEVHARHTVELAWHAEELRIEARALRGSLSPFTERSPSRLPILDALQLAATAGSEWSETWLDPDDLEAGLTGNHGGASGTLAVDEVEDAVRPTSRSLRSRWSTSRGRTDWRAEPPHEWHTRRSSSSPRRESDFGSPQRPDEHALWVRDHRGQLALFFTR